MREEGHTMANRLKFGVNSRNIKPAADDEVDAERWLDLC